MRCGLAMSLVVGLWVVSGVVQAAESLQGVWRLSSGSAEGQALEEPQLKEGKLVIRNDNYTVSLVGIGTMTGTQKLHPSQEPKAIDITDADGPRQGQTCLGIYEMDGDEFRVVFAAPGRPRPSKFLTQPGSGEWMHVWTRVKE